MRLKKIISGGQNGADIAALRVAKKEGFETGGLMPFGFKTLDGPKPEYKEEFGMQVHQSSSYVPRTRSNVWKSDATLRFAFDFESRGEVCTMKAIQDYDKPYLDVDLNDPPHCSDIADWIERLNIEVLNVAGNSEKTAPGTENMVEQILETVLRRLKNRYGQ